MVLAQNRHVDLCNKIEDLNTRKWSYGHLLHDTDAKRDELEKRHHSQQMVPGKLDAHT